MTNPAIPILRGAMDKRHYTVSDVALRSGLSRSTVSRLLNGKLVYHLMMRHMEGLRYVLGDEAVNEAKSLNMGYALDEARKELT